MATAQSTGSQVHIKNEGAEILVVESKEAVRLPLSKGLFSLIDREDYFRVGLWSWSAFRPVGARTWYAQSFCDHGDKKKRLVSLHQYVLSLTGNEVDHINGEGLDNRKSNLRVCSHQQNIWNSQPRDGGTSAFKGVSWRADRSKWRAYIVINAKQRFLGLFADEIEAAKAYDRAAKELFGVFARVNFPND
jgi:hypothetical protein